MELKILNPLLVNWRTGAGINAPLVIVWIFYLLMFSYSFEWPFGKAKWISYIISRYEYDIHLTLASILSYCFCPALVWASAEWGILIEVSNKYLQDKVKSFPLLAKPLKFNLPIISL